MMLTQAFTFIPIIAKYPAELERRKVFAEFIASATDLIKSQNFKGNPVEVGKGLTAMPEGWNRLRVRPFFAELTSGQESIWQEAGVRPLVMYNFGFTKRVRREHWLDRMETACTNRSEPILPDHQQDIHLHG